MADDDFWNESEVKTSANMFDFDDRESGGGFGESSSLQMCGISLDGTSQLFQQVQAGLRQSGSDSSSVIDKKLATQLDLNQLISERALNCFLDADSPQFTASKSDLNPEEEVRILRRQLEDMWSTPDPKTTARKMMLKQPFMLELFRSLESKKQLLKEVIALGDGDSILSVVVFLSRTLKKTYLNQILLELPIAANHYVAYLSSRQRVSELTDLLDMLGRSKDASMKQLEVAIQSPPQRQLQNVVTCSRNHLFDSRDAQILDSYIKFLEWQEETGVKEPHSVVDALHLLCEKHWGDSKGPLNPTVLCQLQRVGDKQFQWTAVTARAKAGAWQDIQSLLTAKSWLRGPKLRVCLPTEHVVRSLHSSGAPQDLLYTLLQLIDNVDKRLAVARAVSCDKAIIEASITLRDKTPSLPGRKISQQSN